MMKLGHRIAAGVSAAVCATCLGLAGIQIAQAVRAEISPEQGRPEAAGIPDGIRKRLEELAGREKAAVDFVMFTTEAVDGPGTVQTGSRFASLDDLLAVRPEAEWCYFMLGRDGYAQQVILARTDGGGDIRSELITEETAAAVGMDVRRVEALRGLCRFRGGRSA